MASPAYMACGAAGGQVNGLMGVPENPAFAATSATAFPARRPRILADPLDLADVRRSLRGDGAAYRRLVERYQFHVSAMMWRLSRDPDVHEDLVQEVFVRAYESLPSYLGKAPFAHWLSGIATRVGYEYWRLQKRDRSRGQAALKELHELVEGPADAADGIDPARAAKLLLGLLGQLPPRDHLVLRLRYVEEKSVAETAQLTGWSRTMVKVQALRARRKLRQLFEQAARETGG
jgi:RNA polymerase sigma-70 factor (ECF subfamily)